VFVPGEKISQGSLGKADGRKNAYVLFRIWQSILESATVTKSH